MKKICVLGSTGSIGTQTLEVVEAFPNELKVEAISGHKNIDLLEKQINLFNPKICAVMDREKGLQLANRITGSTKILFGLEGLIEAAVSSDVDMVVIAVSGMIGLIPTIEAIKNHKTIALANKETLVAAGELIMPMIQHKPLTILPVDSEHSAIFQSLQGNPLDSIRKILLTASGGPFRDKDAFAIQQATLSDVLKHPNWVMGQKITVDSATLMNKGLEAIEAKWLFNLQPDQIEVVVHPQSIIHSGIVYQDGSVIAQMGYPDMKLPIQYALFYPNRMANTSPSLNLFDLGQLTFERPRTDLFPCLSLAFEAMKIGKSMPVVLNRANEIYVDQFIKGHIGFAEIPSKIEAIMDRHSVINLDSVEVVQEVAIWTERSIAQW